MMFPEVHEIWYRNSPIIKVSGVLGLFPKATSRNLTTYSSVRLLKRILVVFTWAMVPAQIPNVLSAINFKFTSAAVKLFSTYSLFSCIAVAHLHVKYLLKIRPVIVRRFHRPVSPAYYRTVTVAVAVQCGTKFLLAVGNTAEYNFDAFIRLFGAACQEVTDFLVTLIIIQFCSNVDTLAESQRLASKLLHKEVQDGVDQTEKIRNLYDSCNEVYKRQITWAFVHYLTKIVIMSYYTYWLALQGKTVTDSVKWGYNLTKNVVAIPFMFLQICLPIASCQNMKNMVDAFNYELFQIIRKDEDLCKDIIAAVTTYLVILTQFSIDDAQNTR